MSGPRRRLRPVSWWCRSKTTSGRIVDLHVALDRAIDDAIDEQRTRLASLASHRASPSRAIRSTRRQRLDELVGRLDAAEEAQRADLQYRLERVTDRWRHADPTRRITEATQDLKRHAQALARGAALVGERAEARMRQGAGRLDALSPLGVISRGYSVVQDADGNLVKTRGQA